MCPEWLETIGLPKVFQTPDGLCSSPSADINLLSVAGICTRWTDSFHPVKHVVIVGT